MQMVLQKHLGDAFVVESAGLTRELAGRPANHRSVACMQERGLDLSNHTSRYIGDLNNLDQFRWVICVGPDEADKVRAILGASSPNVLIANEDQGGILDPYELGMEGYQACAASLDRVMPNVAKQIREGSS